MNKADIKTITKVALLILVFAYFCLLVTDCVRVIYYQVKLNELDVRINNKYEETRSIEAVEKDIRSFMNNILVDKDEQIKFTEYNYEYYVKLGTPPFNFIFKKGFKVSGSTIINKE